MFKRRDRRAGKGTATGEPNEEVSIPAPPQEPVKTPLSPSLRHIADEAQKNPRRYLTFR